MNQNFLKVSRFLIGLSQGELAKELGITQQAVSKMELGRMGISEKTKDKVYQVLSAKNLDLDEIFLLEKFK